MEINGTSSIVDNHAMVASASAGISGVCSVAGRVGVERASAGVSGVCSVAGRFLEGLPWSCGLFPIEPNRT